ncbi:MAG: hypothetical protein ACI4P9_08985, partial [Selenomonadaceae bacterium]
NDIRVDLDVMLAQAELQRAKEANELKLWRRWLYWTVPWVLAVMVAAGYFFLLRPDNSAGEAPVLYQDNLSQGEPGTAEMLIPQQEGVAQGDAIMADIPAEEQVINEPSGSGISSYEADSNNDNKQSIREISPDMQRMMQTAGKVLRE